MNSFSFNWFEFIAATLLYTAVLLSTLKFNYYYRKYLLIFDNKSFNLFTIITIITSLCIIYRTQLASLLMSPPPYAILSAIILYILTNSINNFQKQLESNKVFTHEQTGLLNKQIDHTEKSVNFELDQIRKNELKTIDGRVEKLEELVEKLESRVGKLETAVEKLEVAVNKIPKLITDNNVTLLEQIKQLIQENK